MAQTQFRSDDTEKWWLGFGNGSDGSLTISSNTTDAPVDASCSGTVGNLTLSATNASFTAGKPVLIHQSRGTGAGSWELNQIASYTTGTITLKKALKNTYTDSGASQAQVIQLKQYNNVTVNSGVTWTAKTWAGDVGGILAFLAKGTVTVTGTIHASRVGYRTGYADPNVNGNGLAGEGTNGDRVDTRLANGSGGGGGEKGGSSTTASGPGGGGGHATTGFNGSTGLGKNYGRGGGTSGNAGLTNMTFGGGGGSYGTNTTYGNNGATGDGGGIVAIFARELVVTGLVSSDGGNGTNWLNGGGGGAGGSVLLKAVTATLGTSKVTAQKGFGVTSKSGDGSVGRIHLDYSESYTGTTIPTLDVRQDLTIIPLAGGSPLFFSQL